MDSRETECTTCRARATYTPRDPFSGCGIIHWRYPKDESAEEPWAFVKMGYLPTLCVRCTARRCPHCGR